MAHGHDVIWPEKYASRPMTKASFAHAVQTKGTPQLYRLHEVEQKLCTCVIYIVYIGNGLGYHKFVTLVAMW